MTSSEGEVISMPKSVKHSNYRVHLLGFYNVTACRNVRANGPVEQWLGSVEIGMFDTVKRHMRLGLADHHTSQLEDWILKHPGQVVLSVVRYFIHILLL